ncbi:aminoglycoside phosphotransferase family protein [Congregibacter litoralis]|uniref:Putative phosphotransferase n=1 Tax=Congregibacter litoralis KT71 TaxID=314285 RepID=A4A6U7_9GAMM|nr:phosphotransferase [Congregibacter litoralis]EAQ98016.1 putative phosphotransferase [Congregibacter litoralis KT71]
MSVTERAEQLAQWFETWKGVRPTLKPVAGDASFRRYFRVAEEGRTLILCDAPPETEKNREFVSLAGSLAAAGLRVPAVLHADFELGFLVLEDLGDQTLLPLLTTRTVDGYYEEALGMLEALAVADPGDFSLAPYDRALLSREMNLFPEWFVEGLLGLDYDQSARGLFTALQTLLCDRALAQKQVVVHRDFHARNLMRLDDGALATIDFQDAVLGPLTYDPVSLLKDCYLRWPDDQVRGWVLAYRDRLESRGLGVQKADEFLKDFDFMGLQRHIKVLGIFARLYLRDGKPAYLGDLPRVMAYVQAALAGYPDSEEVAAFAAWFDDQVVPAAREQSWFHESP